MAVSEKVATRKTGRFAIIEQFLANDITFMFGNPGTVEQGFLDSLEAYPDFKYILTLQETIAVAMADGYARATKKPTLVQLHSGVGLGNGIGMMYQAMRGHAPLVVVAGEAGVRYDAMDAQMAADLVSMAKPVTKWATRVTHAGSLLRVLRRAIKMAATPPMGPVFVALPMDVLDEVSQEQVVKTSALVTRAAPEEAELAGAAAALAAAKKPLILMGDGIAASGAQAELAKVAELTGAEVWGVDASEVNISATHPLFKGLTGHMFGEHSREIIAQADMILVCGTYVFPEVFPELGDVFAGAKVVHIDLNVYEIAKNFSVDFGFVSDPKLTLGRLVRVLEANMTQGQKEAAKARADALAAAKEEELKAQLDRDKAVRDEVPLHASRFMEELAGQLPKDAVIFDEALTCSPELVRYLPPTEPGHYFQTRGGSLGVGIPGALGLKLAHPDKTVIGFSGDGGSMYTIQALWTAAHHNIGAKFVILNNQSYLLLKLNILQYWRERGIEEHEFPHSFDLAEPVVRFDELARSMGVEAARVETPDQIGPAIRRMLSHDGPFLLDVILSDHVPGTKISPKCGQ
jgi:thiamine pyrophosphate-dependent acetolactate synthase large subunit-like protein